MREKKKCLYKKNERYLVTDIETLVRDQNVVIQKGYNKMGKKGMKLALKDLNS